MDPPLSPEHRTIARRTTRCGRFALAHGLLSGKGMIPNTPVHVRARTELDEKTRRWIADRTARRLGKFAPRIERMTFRFEDVNGPRGGRDTVCRGKVVLRGLPSAIVEKRAHTPREAFDQVSQQLARSVNEAVRDQGRLPPVKRPRPPAVARPKREPIAPEGELIGRRVGRSRKRVELAASRPEKLRGDAIVDTALPGVSATDRKVGANATAKRNTQLRAQRATATLEDSATGQPSRKSTRRSANRAKSGSKIERAVKRKLHKPQARARRAKRKRR
jgi:hypothetical protein